MEQVEQGGKRTGEGRNGKTLGGKTTQEQLKSKTMLCCIIICSVFVAGHVFVWFGHWPRSGVGPQARSALLS